MICLFTLLIKCTNQMNKMGVTWGWSNIRSKFIYLSLSWLMWLSPSVDSVLLSSLCEHLCCCQVLGAKWAASELSLKTELMVLDIHMLTQQEENAFKFTDCPVTCPFFFFSSRPWCNSHFLQTHQPLLCYLYAHFTVLFQQHYASFQDLYLILSTAHTRICIVCTVYK